MSDRLKAIKRLGIVLVLATVLGLGINSIWILVGIYFGGIALILSLSLIIAVLWYIAYRLFLMDVKNEKPLQKE